MIYLASVQPNVASESFGFLLMAGIIGATVITYLSWLYLPKLFRILFRESLIALKGKTFYVHIRTTDGRKTDMESLVLNQLLSHGAIGRFQTADDVDLYCPTSSDDNVTEKISMPNSEDCYTLIGRLKTYRHTDPDQAISTRVLLDFRVIDFQNQIIFANSEKEYSQHTEDRDQDYLLHNTMKELARVIGNQIANHLANK
ncbi:hypothetical protein HOK15_01430 [Candidatus Falkowbacteria bacterium]|jgi:hypothetical protein|nr:hypothetical protein [Candidatus Falkowbacteria bacterium]MBT5502852.1 hypothetical protein [Candidatus Falkowbacteria bacterium]MBT6574618.1 hypothetical protein [Candidatus Falkowbacteria bacterium]